MNGLDARISQIIESLGITKTKFASRINVSPAFISQLCSGTKLPSDRTIIDIGEEFGINEIWLRTGEGEMFQPLSRREQIARFAGELMREPEDSFRLRLVDALSRLSVEEWEALRKIAEEMAGGKS